VVLGACFVVRHGDVFTLSVARELGDEVLTRLRQFRLRVDCEFELVEEATGPFATLREQVEAGWPGPHEFAAQLTPHCFGVRVVNACVSFTKGCYTGQELVGRLDARGAKVPWRLVRATGAVLASIDEALRSRGPEGPQGVTTGLAGPPAIALGFAHRTLIDALDDGRVGEVALEVL
jgi:folate-binding protein YgfZ